LKFFVYRYGLISISSFLLSNLLYNLFIIKFHASLASLFSLILVLNINILFFFKLKVFKANKNNYLKIVFISIFFRIFEYFLFNYLYLYLLVEIQSSYIFAITLIFSFTIKSIVFYKSSDSK
jgi:hypothetical protein